MTYSPGQAAALALYEQQRRPLFPLGQVLITPGALDMLEALELAPLPFVLRHAGEVQPDPPVRARKNPASLRGLTGLPDGGRRKD